MRPFACRFSVCFAVLIFARGASAEETVESFLQREVLGPDQTRIELQHYAAARIPPVPVASTSQQWEGIARRIRQQVLDEVILRGEAARWRDSEMRVEWLETIPGGSGYHIKKLRYEALPGLWVPALLYEPEGLTGKVPVVLNVNGHDAAGKAVPYKQVRCINQAKRGMLALNVEWFGMGQFRTPAYNHYRLNQLDLCGTSGLAPFYLSLERGLDVLLAHKHADPKRVAVTGLSGGGWQTILISSLDPRVTLACPVAGYSSFTSGIAFDDLGDSEQSPCDLLTVADYAHLTALRAPRPTLLTYNAEDDCCFRAGHALGPLVAAARPIFQLYGKEANLRSHVNHDPGTHNYEKENREAFYRFLGEHFYPQASHFDASEIPCDDELKSAEELHVPLPSDNADFHSLARDLSRHLPRHSKLPSSQDEAEAWQRTEREYLAKVVHLKHYVVQAELTGQEEDAGVTAWFWRLGMGGDWTVPAVELVKGKPTATAILLADDGRGSLADVVIHQLDQGNRVVAIDPFYFGESKPTGPDSDVCYALLLSVVGDRPLGLQAGQVAAVASWLRTRHPTEAVSLACHGRRTSVLGLVAASLETDAISSVELHGLPGSLKELIEQNETVEAAPELFCFGLLERFDVKHLAALVAPRPILVLEPSDRVRRELASLQDWYEKLIVGPLPVP